MYFLLTALAMSAGWGIRGQFGHEYGAAMAGVLGAAAVVLLSGRRDWERRVHYFAMFGALGWSFGGSMSYMKAVAYAHSSGGPTLWYGFGCLFVIGFLWTALGGAGSALPAYFSREDLTSAFIPLTAVFGAWLLQDIYSDLWEPLELFDTDWLAATIAIAAALLVAATRRRVEPGTSLILHLAFGWWAGFAGLVPLAGFRMTPPRGDNWAGCAGMVAGVLVFCVRRKQVGIAFAARWRRDSRAVPAIRSRTR